MLDSKQLLHEKGLRSSTSCVLHPAKTRTIKACNMQLNLLSFVLDGKFISSFHGRSQSLLLLFVSPNLMAVIILLINSLLASSFFFCITILWQVHFLKMPSIRHFFSHPTRILLWTELRQINEWSPLPPSPPSWTVVVSLVTCTSSSYMVVGSLLITVLLINDSFHWTQRSKLT